MTEIELENYLLDNYGNCKLSPCQCIKRKEWKGRLCENWQPKGYKTWNDVFKNETTIHKNVENKTVILEPIKA